MYFTNWRFSSPSIHEYQTSKGDSGPRKKRPEPKLILHEKTFPRRASTGERLRTCVRGTWNRTYLRETISNLQGSFCPNFSFTEFSMNFKSFVSDLFPFDTGTMDLRSNPFEEGGNDVPQSTDHYMEPAQHGVQDVLNISTEVQVFHRARLDLDHARLEKDHARLEKDHPRLEKDQPISHKMIETSLFWLDWPILHVPATVLVTSRARPKRKLKCRRPKKRKP